MPHPLPLLAAATGCAACLAGPLAAQTTILPGNHSVTGDLCVGHSCTSSESFGTNSLKLKEYDLGIIFEDVTTQTSTYSSNDWRIAINNPFTPESYFAIEDLDGNGQVLRLEAGAPANALTITSEGDLGLGTALPVGDLHIVDGFIPSIRLEQDGSKGYPPQQWDIGANQYAFGITSFGPPISTPFSISADAPSYAFSISGNGGIVMGSPSETETASLYVARGNGTAQLKIEETNDTQTARPLLNMVNHGRPDIIMANTATGGEWAFGAGTNFVLKNGAVGSSDGDKNLQLKLYGATGNLEIAGQIITGGPTCSGGCDAVFSESYDLRSISEHAAEMFALGHLPNVGPTAPNAPVNMSEQYGRLLNELEHAHIYIAELESEVSQLKTTIRRIPDLEARLAGMEARLAQN